jgi:transposase-like protein
MTPRLDRREAIQRLLAEGNSCRATARLLGCSDRTVRIWRDRATLRTRPGRGRKPRITPGILETKASELAAAGEPVTARGLAQACGASLATVYRTVKRAGLSQRFGWRSFVHERSKEPAVTRLPEGDRRAYGCGGWGVPNGSYRTRAGRRPQWRCSRGCGVPRRSTIYYRRRWGESRLNFIALMFRSSRREELADTVRFLSDTLEIPPSSLRRVRRSLMRGSRALDHLTDAALERCAKQNHEWLMQVLERDDQPLRFAENLYGIRLAFSRRSVWTATWS